MELEIIVTEIELDIIIDALEFYLDDGVTSNQRRIELIQKLLIKLKAE